MSTTMHRLIQDYANQVAPMTIAARATCLASVLITLVIVMCTIPCLVAQWHVSPYGSMRIRFYLLTITLLIVFADTINNLVLAISLFTQYKYSLHLFYYIRTVSFASVLGPLLVSVLQRTCGILLVNHPLHRHILLSFGVIVAVGLTIVIGSSILKETFDLHQLQISTGNPRVWDMFEVPPYGTLARFTYPVVVIVASWWSLSVAFPSESHSSKDNHVVNKSGHKQTAKLCSRASKHYQVRPSTLPPQRATTHFSFFQPDAQPVSPILHFNPFQSHVVPTTTPTSPLNVPLTATSSLPPFLNPPVPSRPRQPYLSVHNPPIPRPYRSTLSTPLHQYYSHQSCLSKHSSHLNSYSSSIQQYPIQRQRGPSTTASNTQKVSTVKLPLTNTFRWLSVAVAVLWLIEAAIALIDRSVLNPRLRSTLCSLVLACAVLLETAFILIFRLHCRRAVNAVDEGAFHSFKCRVLRWIHGPHYDDKQADLVDQLSGACSG